MVEEKVHKETHMLEINDPNTTLLELPIEEDENDPRLGLFEGAYVIEKKIGAGSFGELYSGMFSHIV